MRPHCCVAAVLPHGLLTQPSKFAAACDNHQTLHACFCLCRYGGFNFSTSTVLMAMAFLQLVQAAVSLVLGRHTVDKVSVLANSGAWQGRHSQGCDYPRVTAVSQPWLAAASAAHTCCCA